MRRIQISYFLSNTNYKINWISIVIASLPRKLDDCLGNVILTFRLIKTYQELDRQLCVVLSVMCSFSHSRGFPDTYVYMYHLSQLLRLWYFSSSVNSFRAQSSHPVGLDVWFLVGPFDYFHTSCVRKAKALARLRGCAGSPEPSLVAYVTHELQFTERL